MKKVTLIISTLMYSLNFYGQCTEPRTPFIEHSIPGVVEFEDFDNGCPGEVYYDADEANNGGKYRATRVDIESCGDNGGGYNIGWLAVGEWLEYTVNIASAGTYSIDFRIASSSDYNKFQLNVDGIPVTGIIELPNTGEGLQTYRSYNETVQLEAGRHILRFTVINASGAFNINRMTINSLDLVWDFTSGLESWILANNLTGSVVGGIMNLNITAGDPYMNSPGNLNITATNHRTIIIRMKNNTSDTEGRIYFTTNTNPGFSEINSVPYSLTPNDTGYTEYVVDMSQNPAWQGTVTQIRLDPLTNATSGTIEIDYIKVAGSACTMQTISFTKTGKKFINDPPFGLTATSTSGLPVTFSIVSGPASIDGDTVTLTGEPGLVVIAARQPGDAGNCPADEVRQTVFVWNPSASTQTEQLKAYSDQWVATDGIGRILPSYSECGNYRSDKYIGVFYWLWHADISNQKPIRPVPELLRENPDSPAFECMNYYWGEPENGFYHPSDPWSTRRNLQMLANAGVDFVFFDFTNGNQGCNSLDDFMTVALDMQGKGIPVPKIAFFMNENYNSALTCVMEKIYTNPQYDPMIFKWEGKPLLMADSVKCATQCALCLDESVKDFFTWRRTWAFETGQWNFLDTYPQDYYILDGKPEQMPVCKAMGAPLFDFTLQGSSSHNKKAPEYDQYWETDQSKYGYFFEEQWTRGHEVDPTILCITGWNELMAGAWPTEGVRFMGKEWNNSSWRCVSPSTCLSRNPDGTHKWPHGWHFVDEFNMEFNRDLEPMKGGYTDNYFYQLVSHIRRFKGMTAPETISQPKNIMVDGDFSDWQDVTPVYKDAAGDVINRNFKNVNNTATYTNLTARNDIDESRLTYDNDSMYFYVKTLENITPPEGNNWMLLFLDVDRKNGTGWEGYDYAVNMEVIPGLATFVKQWDGISWGNAGVAAYHVKGREMEISISRADLGMEIGTPELYFHWADNPQHLKDISAFFTDGESAPDRRFNYNYSSSKVTTLPREPFTQLEIPGTIEFEDFDNGGVGVAYADADIINRGGKYRPEESVDIEEKSEGENCVSFINSNEWLEYTVDVKAIGLFTAAIHYAAENENKEAVIYIDGMEKSGVISLPATGGMNVWSTIDTEFRLTAGTHIMRFFVKNAMGGFSIDNIVFKEKDVVYPGNGEGLYKSLWKASIGGRTWFVELMCGETDPVIDEEWADVSPGCGIDKDFWNIRWEGQLEPLFTEEHTFSLTVNDIGKLWVNDQLVIDAWVATSTGKTHTGTIALTAGQKVNIRLDYAEKSGDAFVKLEWESSSLPKEVVPFYQLYPKLNTAIGSIGGTDQVISIYPNPAGSYIIIDAANTGIKQFSVFDSKGCLVYSDLENFSGIKRLNTNRFDRGLYIVRCITNDSVISHKFLLQ